MAFTLVRRLARHVKARRAQWTAETDRAFHDAIFAAQDFDPFDPAYPGRITIRRFADLASPYVAQAGSVADLGCGPGEITCELAARFPSIRFTGWDHSQAAIDRARHLASSKALTNVDFAMADIGRMRVPDRSDLAMMFDSFHHLPQPAQFVASNTHVPRWFLVEPAGDALGRWRYTVDLDWVLQELDKIRWRLEHQLNVTAAAPRDRAAKSEEPAPGPDGAVEFRYALDDYLGFFDGYGVSAVGTSAGIVKYPPAPHIGSPLRKAFNEFTYQLLCDADAALRSRDEDLAARHWAIYCARGETFAKRQVRRPPPQDVKAEPIVGPYGVRYEIIRAPEIAIPNETLGVALRVENRGFLPWPCTGDHPVNVSYHWLTSRHRRTLAEGLRTPLARAVLPGDATTTHAVVKAPSSPGAYLLEFDLVHEGMTWFSEAGQPTATCKVQVVPGREAG